MSLHGWDSASEMTYTVSGQVGR